MKDNPILLLQLYGLDQLLDDQDDPHLWAAAVGKHWPEPNDPNLQIPRILFGVGRIVSKEETITSHHPSGMVIIKEWHFERTDGGSLKPIPIEHEVSWQLYPEHILHVSRPSASQKTAIVHAGSNPAPLIGGGQTNVWKRQVDGSWIEADEVITAWKT